MTIISANEAKFKSGFGKIYNALQEDIAKLIIKATDKGYYKCVVDVAIENMDSEMRKRIKTLLNSLGYGVNITNHAEENKGCPCDQASYFEQITITW